jgi:predicted dehydrogenase
MDCTEGLHVHGERGSIEARAGSPHSKSRAEVSVFDAANQEYRIPTTPDSDPCERQLEGFAGALAGSFDVSPSGHDGLHDRRVLAATSKSLGPGTRVSV